MLAIYKKELKSYFTSMTGYVFIAFFLCIIGIYYVAYNLGGALANFEYVLSSTSFLFVLLVPILTMRIMAEEKKQKTDQLLYTSPLPPVSIIIGKYLAVFTVFLIAIAIVSLYPIILLQFGNVPLKIAYGSILGFLLLGSAYIAMGLFISSLTESQLVSAVISFVVILITVLMSGIVEMFPKDNKSAWAIFSVILILICLITYAVIHNVTLSLSLGIVGEAALTLIYFLRPTLFDGLVVRFFNWFSIIERYDNFLMGMLDLSAVIYYISIVFLFLFLTVQSIKKSRWN